MKSKTNDNSGLYRRRKRIVASVVLVSFLFLLFINLASYFFIKSIGNHLEHSLNQRLQTAGQLATELIERDIKNLENQNERAFARLLLFQLRTENGFESVYIIDKDMNVLLDSERTSELQISRGYLHQDSIAITKTLKGDPSISKLYNLSGHYFKNAYIPIDITSEEQAILVLEANAEFFEMIRLYHHGLLVVASASVILLLLLIIFLVWSTSLFFKTEKQLEQSKQLAALGQMAATVAHEIRNPLGIIKSSTDVLKERKNYSANQDELFDFINDEISRINLLVNDFLDLSKEPTLNCALTNLNMIIQNCVNTLETKYQSISISFKYSKTILLSCDSEKIHQVIFNLLLNAIQAVSQDTGLVEIHLTITHVKSKKFAKISIMDNGYGIKSNADDIFEPFISTKHKGTGLGLAISKRIIEKHQGKIIAKSRPESGSEFIVYLPIDS